MTMPSKMPCIGREKELNRVEQILRCWGTRQVVFISGRRGIGKTRLLQEIHQRYSQQDGCLFVANVLDLDDPSVRTWDGLGQKIVAMIGEGYFAQYLDALKDWNTMKVAGVSQMSLDSQSKTILQAFAAGLNQAAVERRIVLSIDTAEKLLDTGLWARLHEVALLAKNAAFLLAGYNIEQLGDEFQIGLEDDFHFIDLQPLSTEECTQYLERKQKILLVSIEPKLAHKLLMLARGRPIILDLAIEWLSRDIPIQWLNEIDLDELKSLPLRELEKRQEDFEAQLVYHIAQVRRPVDQLILLMSHIYPLDQDMISVLLRLPLKEAKNTFEDAKTYAFVKSIPRDRIALHDEMQRLVSVHVWPEVDGDGSRQRSNGWAAATYLESRLQVLRSQAEEAKTWSEETGEMISKELLEKEIWALEEQRLHHALIADVKWGIEIFIRAFDQAAKAYDTQLQKMLCMQIKQHIASLPQKWDYEINSRLAQYHYDTSDFQGAKEIISKVLAENQLAIAQQVDILLLLGNTEIRLGYLIKGIENFERAITLSDQVGDLEMQAGSRNTLGWACRFLGQDDRAYCLYDKALELNSKARLICTDESKSVQLKRQRGWIYNNMAYLLGRMEYNGVSESALDLCQDAEDLLKSINDQRILGGLYFSRQYIHRRRKEYDFALHYINLAWEIFCKQNDLEWMCRVSIDRGAAHREKGLILLEGNNIEDANTQFQWAKESLLTALQLEIKAYMPETLYWLAEVHLSTQQFDEAVEYNEQGLTVAPNPRISRFYYYLFAQRTHLTYLLKKDHKLMDLYNTYTKFEGEDWLDVHQPPADAMFYYYLGNIALRRYCLEGTEQLASLAIDCYLEAFPKMAKHLVYGPYQFVPLLDELDKLMIVCCDAPGMRCFKQKLGQKLYEYWDTTDVVPGITFRRKYRRGFEFFAKWQNVQSTL
jgi:tetratricopeptide (TPR) repeat protein